MTSMAIATLMISIAGGFAFGNQRNNDSGKENYRTGDYARSVLAAKSRSVDMQRSHQQHSSQHQHSYYDER